MGKTGKKANNGAVLGFEETLWRAADKLRGHMDTEYIYSSVGHQCGNSSGEVRHVH
jgi:hypothetical protein